MPVFQASASRDHQMHGSVFRSYVAPSMGSVELCAWRLVVPPNTAGVAHRPTREEVILILVGSMTITIDDISAAATVGDVVLVPANAEIRLDVDSEGLEAWVTTTPGIEAITGDGSRISPPWAR